MKEDTTEGCIRCRDYDKIKDELENSKRRSQEEQKNSLKRCEDSKTKLQKKLLTVGAIAIIAGTILGKEFVDKITAYIDSFNDVKNAASGLIGKADNIPTITDTDTEENESEKDEKEEPQKDIFSPDTTWAKISYADDNNWNTSMYDLISLSSNNSMLDMLSNQNTMGMLELDLLYPETFEPIVDSNSISEMIDMFSMDDVMYPFDMQIYPENYYDDAYTDTMYNQPPIIPETHGWLAFFGLPILFRRQRRRV